MTGSVRIIHAMLMLQS